jgi:hypothetical protein
MDILQSMLNSQGTTVPPPSGPRTQGRRCDCTRRFKNRRFLADHATCRPRRKCHERTPIDGTCREPAYNDRHVLVHTDKIVHDFVNDWVTQLKYDFQHMRLTNKRMAEFLDAVYSGECTRL